MSSEKHNQMGFIGSKPGDAAGDSSLSFEEAKQLRAEFMKMIVEDDESAAVNKAAAFLLDQEFQKCIAAYEVIAEKYPDSKATAISQIGACQYFLKDFASAIDSYVKARDLGEDADMMDDNIWEACEALAASIGADKAKAKYLELCPKGQYRDKDIQPANGSASEEGCLGAVLAAITSLVTANVVFENWFYVG